MCTGEQHEQKMQALARIEKHMHTLIGGRKPENWTENVSDTQGFILNYRNRKHVYVYSTTPLTFVLGALGNTPILQNEWKLIDFQEGFKIFTVGTASPVLVFLKATDEVIA